MPRCSICAHPDRDAIDRDLLNQQTFRYVAEKYGVTASSAFRHRRGHLGRGLARIPRAYDPAARARLGADLEAQRAATIARAAELLCQAEVVMADLDKLVRACDVWLADSRRRGRYDLDPRAEEILVRYTAVGPRGRPVPARARLSALLAAVEQGRLDPTLPRPAPEHSEGDRDAASARLRRDAVLGINDVAIRRLDPRELLLKAEQRFHVELVFLRNALRQLADLAPEPQPVPLRDHPDWPRMQRVILRAFSIYPDARLVVSAAMDRVLSGP